MMTDEIILEPGQERINLAAMGSVLDGGRFEVDAITAGVGNGWTFSEEVLKASVDLWGGVECFVDHGGLWGGRSGRDLELRTLGPAAGLVEALGREILAEDRDAEGRPRAKPRIGFSADVIFTVGRKLHDSSREVKSILRVVSLDLVFNPARGGAFVRALNSIGGGFEMATHEEDQTTTPQPAGQPVQDAPAQPAAAQLREDAAAMRSFLAVHEEQQALAEQAEEARQLRAQMCGYLLDAALSSAKLPAAMAGHVRKQFEGRVFEAAELTRAIDEARELVSALGGAGVIAGPGRISGMFSSEDQLQAAVDDMLEAPRAKGSENLKAARLSGIKELYMMLTGDRNLYGGYYADRVQLATTANFTGLVKNAMNKIVANQWDLLGAAGYDWWMRVTNQEHFETLNTITGTLVGTVGSLPEVAEGGVYTELAIGDSPETADFTKYGGYVPLTLELIDRDNTRKLRQYPRELAKASIRQVSGLVAAVFTANAGIGPTMADTGALFNATAVTTAGGHANLLTTALSAAQWEVVAAAMYVQPLLIRQAATYYGTGPAMAIDPKYLLVPRKLRLTAMKILYPSWENAANIHSENLQRGEMGDVVVVPEWTDVTDWAAVADPRLVPGITVGERFGLMPEIFIAGDELSPAVFTNDEHRIKVRHFLVVLVQDFRPLHKSNVGG
jgi:hypothetical protein